MVYSTRRFVLCLTLCHFVLVFFSPFTIAITSLGEERVNLSDFRTFVRFVLVRICRFPLPLGVWEGLRFVIVTLPGLFSYLFSYLGFVLSLFVHYLPFFLMPWEGWASWLWRFLGIFTYFCERVYCSLWSFLLEYCEASLQRQHLFEKTLAIKSICCCKESLMNRLTCKKGLVLFLFPYRTYVLDIC